MPRLRSLTFSDHVTWFGRPRPERSVLQAPVSDNSAPSLLSRTPHGEGDFGDLRRYSGDLQLRSDPAMATSCALVKIHHLANGRH